MTLDNLCISMDNFFLCTNIPIRSIKFDGTIIHESGYNETLDKLFREANIFEATKEYLLKERNNPYVTVKTSESTCYTAFNICSCNIDSGIFVFGPYITDFKNIIDFKIHKSSIVYKPLSCIPHLVALFHNIRDGGYSLESDKGKLNSYSIYTEKAITYMKNNYHKSITLDDIADHVKINRCYFCNVFKKETGKTFSQVLNDIRIDKSKELLKNRSLSILEVSLSVGFNNQNYFNLIFKKLTNMTPLEYRNQD